TNLSREPSRSATIFAAERARASGARVVLELDFRPDQWHDPRAYGVTVRSIFNLVDTVLGTQDEINASMLSEADHMRLTHSQVSDTRVEGDTESAIARILAAGPDAVVEKRGADGARVHLTNGDVVDAPGYPVDVQNILGAGD